MTIIHQNLWKVPVDLGDTGRRLIEVMRLKFIHRLDGPDSAADLERERYKELFPQSDVFEIDFTSPDALPCGRYVCLTRRIDGNLMMPLAVQAPPP